MRRSMLWEAPSMPTSAYDPGLLCEQETPLAIGKNWFLDQEIPAGGFVRIHDSSQVWESEWKKRESSRRKVCLHAWTQDEDGQSLAGDGTFIKKHECWEGHEQALITTIRKETKRTEELEEAGYRSPTWAVLRALQQRSIVPREWKERQRCLPLLSFSRWDKEIYSSGGKKKDQR